MALWCSCSYKLFAMISVHLARAWQNRTVAFLLLSLPPQLSGAAATVVVGVSSSPFAAAVLLWRCHPVISLEVLTSDTFRMGSREHKSISDLEEEIFHKFRDFMTGIAKIDELGIAGNKLLTGFQQALEFIRRPPIDTNSKLVNKVIIANETKRVNAYVTSECRNLNDSIQTVMNCKYNSIF
ncbi:hypothetical protein RJT34_13782 [Clitoria ternatea]|uniref:DUF7795 domain-containing protein n=1 Tax=Clitoria ternatea TaxID=43366 RepID=A0AAN9PKH4_CLITE